MKKYKSAIVIVLVFVLLVVAFATTGKKPENEPVISSVPVSSEPVDTTVPEPSGEQEIESENEPVEEVPDTVVSVLAVGDNIVHGSMYNDAKEKAGDGELDFSYVYKRVAGTIKEADIAYVNVETLIGGDEYGFSGYPNFNSPDAMGELLVELGFDVMNVAHNHMLDAPGSDKALYLRNCAAFFEENGTTPIGYYKDAADTENIRITEVKGVKIAWLAYTYEDSVGSMTLNGHSGKNCKDAYIPFLNKELISKQVAIAKEKADAVLISVHWGVEDSWSATDGTFALNDIQKEYGQYFADVGADAVIGMHPHVIQKSEWLTGKNGNKCFCAYSLGNFISGMENGRNMVGAMMQFNIVKDGKTGEIRIESPYMIPTVSQYSRKQSGSFRDFEIIPFSEYTDELAKAHGCHNLDDARISQKKNGMLFTYEAIEKKIKSTFAPEFLQAS